MNDAEKPKPASDLNPLPDEVQRVFDATLGPNLRLKDNLIQLATIIFGTLLGMGIGAGQAWHGGGDVKGGLIIGALAGVIVSLVLSGMFLGLLRFVGAFKQR
jgi:hypothetical protein